MMSVIAGRSTPFRGHGCRHRRGYVLIVTLGVLVLASTLLVGIGRVAMKHAADARAAGDDLQRRWGATSCRQAILPIAERLLDAEESKVGGPVARWTATIRLGSQQFELTLADEQAKADLNALLNGEEVPTIEARIRQALVGYGLADKVRLRPEVAHAVPAAEKAGEKAPLGSFGQVFDNVEPERWLRPPAGGGPAPAELMTCWTGGRVNIRRVSEPALRLAASPPLSSLEISRLLEARDQLFYGEGRRLVPALPAGSALPTGSGRSPIRRLVAAANLSAGSARIASGFADGSTRHSLWIAAGNGRRRWLSFAVLDTTDIDRPVWTVRAW